MILFTPQCSTCIQYVNAVLGFSVEHSTECKNPDSVDHSRETLCRRGQARRLTFQPCVGTYEQETWNEQYELESQVYMKFHSTV